MISTSSKTIVMFALLLSANLHVHAMVNFGAILGSLSAAVQQVGEELQETEIFFAERGYDSAQLENVLEQIGDLGEAAPIEKRILQLLRMSEQYNQPILEAFCVLLLSRFKENIEEISNAFMNSSLENEINTPGCSGRTVLMHMASLDTGVVDEDVLTRCCRKVIFSGADISLADKNGQTCLHFSAKKHDISLCKIFSTESYPTDKNGNTPLHLALLGESDDNAGDRRLETVQWLIKKYPNLIVEKNRSYWSPLHMACYFGYDNIVIRLINTGARINEQITASDKTALMIACERGHDKVCELLIMRESLKYDLRDNILGTALDWACEFEQVPLCKLLLPKYLPTLNLRDSVSLVRRACQNQNKDLMEYFINKLPWNRVDRAGNSALHIASAKGFTDVVIALLKRVDSLRASVNELNNADKSAQQLAQEKDHLEIVTRLRSV